jgi:hypothetical protein
LNLRPSGYEPDELPGCSTPRRLAPRPGPVAGRARGLGIEARAGLALFRSGGDLLSRVLGRSTIGAAALNGRVRDGIGCFARGCCRQTWRPHGARPAGRSFPAHETVLSNADPRSSSFRGAGGVRLLPDRIEACRAISTGQLHALLRFHLRPIDVVVFHGPQGRPGFEGGFPLRCLQRLSCPHIATLHCRWHDNRSTSGAFTPVLSY